MESSAINSLKKIANTADFCRILLELLERRLNGQPLRFMEVCGTHTTAIFQSGLRTLLPKNIVHISGPGCPVCVTHDSEISLFLQLAEEKDFILATFGDLLRVPVNRGHSLKHAQANGAHIDIVYSPLDSLRLCHLNPDKEIIFIGAGFETTAPLTAATILQAQKADIANFSVLSLHKLIPPALKVLLDDPAHNMDAFLLPGHVATITGLMPFRFLAEEYNMPGVVGGFEPSDILLALLELAEMKAERKADIKNAYPRAVNNNGNSKALAILDSVFENRDADWRGFGTIPGSGFSIKKQFARFDALRKFSLSFPDVKINNACKCGNVLKGQITPRDCPLFGKVCTPANPVGPCMVSTEGSCSAYYKYGEI